MSNPVEYRFSLDLHKNVSNVFCNVMLGDTNSTLIISLTENGEPYDLVHGMTAVLCGIKADGSILYNPVSVAIVDNTLRYIFTEQTANVVGLVTCQIKLAYSGTVKSTPLFRLDVQDNAFSEAVVIDDSENQFNALTEYISLIAEGLANDTFKGDKGDTGEKGDKGDKGDTGPKGDTGEMPDAISTVYSDATSIPSKADLNTYTTPGNYKVTSGAIAQSLQNAPSTGAGRLTVLTTNSANAFLQLYITSGGKMFLRTGSVSTNNGETTINWNVWNDVQYDNGYWKLKNIVCFGDSRTWYHNQNYTDKCKAEYLDKKCVGYQSKLSAITGATITSKGVSGETSAQICDRVRAFDFSSYDAVLLEGGVNDYIKSSQVTIGSLQPIGSNFSTNTIYGAWQSAIEYIRSNNPDIQIFMTVPAICWRIIEGENENAVLEVFPYEIARIKKEIAELYSIPCVDLYRIAGFTESNIDSYCVDDNAQVSYKLHFNNEANAIIGSILGNFINRYFIGEKSPASKKDIAESSMILSHTAATVIPAADGNIVDLNDYRTPGNYILTDSENAQYISNLPVSTAGRLTVMTINGTSAFLQIYQTSSGRFFWRTYSSTNGWRDWKEVATKDDINALGTPFALSHTAAVEIIASENSRVDLDDYHVSGNYMILSSTSTQYINNFPPVSTAGRLTVSTFNSANSFEQKYETSSGRIFWRTGNYNTTKGYRWRDWKEVVSTAALDETSSATVSRQKILDKGAYNAITFLRKKMEYDISFANAFAPIELENYLGNTQNVHPKVLYFENGFGGHKFWMAYTPYPYSNDKVENPCIAYSDDGYNWTDYAENPLAERGNTVTINGTNYTVGYNSDTHLVYRSDTQTLECWYRATVDTTVNGVGDKIEIIYRRTTTDGITWTPAEVLHWDTGHNLTYILSPAIEWDGTNYQIWAVSGAAASRTIRYWSASGDDPSDWTEVRTIDLSYDDDGLAVKPWHMDVIKDGSTYIMLIMCRAGTEIKNNACSLFITTSQDNINYSAPQKVVGGADNWDKYMYRSSIVKVNDTYRIYYSAGSGGSSTIYNNAVWGIGITESTSLSKFFGLSE